MSDADWKRHALDDFSRWLEEVPTDAASALLDPPEAGSEVDLRTLLAELAALRQEVKLQNREQGRAVRELQRAADTERTLEAAVAETVAAGVETRAALEERVRVAAERRSIEPILGVRDALERGLAASRRVASTRGLFQRPPRGIGGVVEGYDMALALLDQTLERLGAHRIPTVNLRFEPTAMRAVEVRETGADQDDHVVEERLSGFLYHGDVLRSAEVVVGRSRRGQTEAGGER